MAATQIFPLAVWESGTNQNSIPANDNALRMQVIMSPAESIANLAPVAPGENDLHIVGATWGGHGADNIVIYKGGTWYEYVPFEGMFKKLIGGNLLIYTGTDWEVYPSSLPVTKEIAVSDEVTALTAGAGKVTFRMPHAMTLNAVRASLTTPQTAGSIVTLDVNHNGSSLLSTKLTIDNGEKTSTTAATPPVISSTALSDDAEITIDIDQLGDGTAKGLKLYLIGTRGAA